MALERAIDRGELDRFEKEPIEFHNRVRDSYLKLSRGHPERISIIDSSKNRGEVESQLLNILKPYFKDHV
jgi:dTMP kinase